MTAQGKASVQSAVWTAVVVAVLLGVFAVLSVTAAADKSPTCDEPLHLVGGYVVRYEHDYRLDPDHPPLFNLLAALPLGAHAMHLDVSDPNYDAAVTRDVTN